MTDFSLKTIFHPLADFVTKEELWILNTVTYWYEGISPQTGELLRLPRTTLVEKVAYKLMDNLANNNFYSSESKMYGVLLVENLQGEKGIIKAFSGLWQGNEHLQGWATQIPGRNKLILAEKYTLEKLDTIKQEIISLQTLAVRNEYQELVTAFEHKWQNIKTLHRQNKQQRNQQREFFKHSLKGADLQVKLAQLEQESRQDDWQQRKFKRLRQDTLQPLLDAVTGADNKIQALKKERKNLSRQLQLQMEGAYSLTNFAGETLTLSEVVNKSFIPTGTGDCSAPKLLHYSATNGLKPLAMAEFWWGKTSPNGEKKSGEFYPACMERCQPIMGFLLSGLSTGIISHNIDQLEIIYEDEYLIIVNKPHGLLSVPGRGIEKFDSAESRLKTSLKDGKNIKAVHRLDQDTSGLLILVKSNNIYTEIAQQFAKKEVKKIYEAILIGMVKDDEGVINLPLWGNPEKRPSQQVNYDHGKPSITHYRVLKREKNQTRIEFLPITGRTHQLRVHSATGLNCPIKGDNLYNDNHDGRLCLHARKITFCHPVTKEKLLFTTMTPF
ncbi:MAG: RluA family pseudouridine synthase [Cyanobacterium sp. T60_A2020_053]|nr:RluA family pseudouridine synthase [Cyanobacterium sp. T60_A2020_053]